MLYFYIQAQKKLTPNPNLFSVGLGVSNDIQLDASGPSLLSSTFGLSCFTYLFSLQLTLFGATPHTAIDITQTRSENFIGLKIYLNKVFISGAIAPPHLVHTVPLAHIFVNTFCAIYPTFWIL